MKEFLEQYGLHLGGSRRRFGSIDCTMRFTLKLIDAVVLECECLTIMQVINDLRKECLTFCYVLKWLYIIIVPIMICKTLTNTTFCDNQFKFNNCFIIELESLALRKWCL